MEPRLTQTQSQKLILAPQLRQFLKLLELPIFELEQKIQQEIEQNPVLEEPSVKTELDSIEDTTQELAQDSQVKDVLEEIDNIGNYRSWEGFSLDNHEEQQKKRDYQESIQTKPPTLCDYLEWQIGLMELGAEERNVASEIIGNINNDGQLVASVEEIVKATGAATEIVENVLKKIQSLDPPGVGGRNLGEILLIQLKKLSTDTALAQKIVSEQLPLLKRKQFDQLARLFQVSPQKIKDVCQQIGHLEPKPGRIFYQERPNFVIPDATVSTGMDDENELNLEMNHDYVPNLRINSMYRDMIRKKDLDPETKAFLKEKIQSGLDLIKAIAQRKSTIQMITEEIMKVQKDFFTKGFAYLKPLRLRDVAERIGVHESTVSRALQGKYLDTPQGTIPYKSFFSNRVESTEIGATESQKSVLERLKNLIANENKKKPLSDAKLVQLLNQEGVKVARRTVAKYRDLLKILPAYLRKG